MEIIFYTLCGTLLAALAVFLFTVFFGAPYVPTHKSQLEKLFDFLKISEKDTVLDIGSGDGIVVKTATLHGANAISFEINPILVAISKFRLRKNPKAKIHLKNFWRAFPVSQKITIFYTFGHGERVEKMFKLAEIQANSQNSPVKFVSYGFEIPHRNATSKIGAHFIYEISPKNSSQSRKNVV